jgi:hypothetical protein
VKLVVSGSTDELELTVIQLRRFMLMLSEVDFCASLMDVKLNS